MSQECTAEVRMVSPEQADTWLFEYDFPGQRTLRNHWVESLAAMMHQGHFLQGSPIKYCRIGSTEVFGQWTAYVARD